MKEKKLKRILEIVPGALSWGLIFFLITLFLINPLVAAAVIIVLLLFWFCRLFYMSALLVMAHHRMVSRKNCDWLTMCKEVKSDLRFEDIVHVVLYTVYKEPKEVLEDSLRAIRDAAYPKENIIIVLAGEEREAGSYLKLESLKAQFYPHAKDILVTVHPDGVEGEIPAKGANATFAAKKAKEYLQAHGYNLSNVIISCFDADTCADKNYFACLTYNFMSQPNRYRMSFQPFPIYNNNIFKAPAFARVIEMGSTFWQLIESMRYEKFITFSSHSMSFKTLVEANYWPVDLISDDSLIFWRCFITCKGDYRTFPLEVPVYMDIAVGKHVFDTVAVQYKQKRRWAWGVENFVYVGLDFAKNKSLPLNVKIRRLFHILDSHVSWATWAVVISFITPLVLMTGRMLQKDSLVMFNLSYINNIIFWVLNFILILCVVMSAEFLPPRPKEISRFIYVLFFLQWLLVPVTSAILGSTPALDAQTRLMLGKYLYFNPTPKKRVRSAHR